MESIQAPTNLNFEYSTGGGFFSSAAPPAVSASLSSSVLYSTAMADAEFHDPERIELLEALETALGIEAIPSPTVWACLWLSDIDRLKDLVREAQAYPLSLRSSFENVERSVKLVQKCEFTNLIL